MTTYLRAVGTVLLTARILMAAGSDFPRRGFVIHGEVISGSVLQPASTIEWRPRGAAEREIVEIGPGGLFDVHGMPGMYALTIEGPQGQILWEEIVQVLDPGQILTVRLPNSSVKPPNQSPVSISELNHKVPPRAQKAFNKGIEAVRHHKQEDAVKYFSEAVAVDPEYAEAHNELGAALLSLERPDEAAEHFQKAIGLVPNYQPALSNLCIALAEMEHWHEAAPVARRSLEIDSDQPAIRFILGTSLVFDHGEPVEALENLRKASTEIPKAHLVAAYLFVETGRPKEAVQELKMYQSRVPLGDADLIKVNAWLTQLEK